MLGKATHPQGRATCPWHSQGLGTVKVDFSPFGQPKLLFPISPCGTSPLCTHSGLLHSRIAVFMPPPQVLEQVPKGLQVPQAPSVTGASSSLGTHIPNLQCCTWRRDMAKVRLCCSALRATDCDQPGQQDSASLISQPHTMILQSNKTELLLLSSVTPMFFFLHTLKWQMKARCWVHGMIYGMKTKDNSNH